MEFSRLEYWSGWPFPSPRDLPNPGIELGSPALQVDSLPTELSGKPQMPGSEHKINDEQGEVKKDTSVFLCRQISSWE